MTTIRIPLPDELDKRLRGLDRLLTARKWERAAIVWAFTTPHPAANAAETRTSFEAFARRELAGLSYRETVARYHSVWQAAIETGHACSVEPGDEIELPELDWPPNPNPSLRTDGTDFADSEDRAAAIKTLAADPELAGRARGALRAATSSPETLRVVAQTATADQALALAEGLRRRAGEQSAALTAGVVGADLPLTAEQVRAALGSPEMRREVVADRDLARGLDQASDEVARERLDRAGLRSIPTRPEDTAADVEAGIIAEISRAQQAVRAASRLLRGAALEEDGRTVLTTAATGLATLVDALQRQLAGVDMDAELSALLSRTD